MVNFQDELKKRTEEINKVIQSYLPEEEGFAKTMAQAMNYSILAGGKRLRPMLILETLRLFGGEEKLAYPFREAMGVLSGVALLNYAYEVMLTAFDTADTPDCQAHVIQALKVMSHKTGLYGMLGGQSVDVENDGKPMSREMIDYIYENKTSALIEASVMTGAILGGATEEETVIVEKAAKNIGLAFQIQDDILDVTSTEEELGKPIHSDEKNHKTTYVTLMGIEKASQQVKKLSDEAVTLFEGLNKKNEFLFTLVNELVGRRK